jgi:hypothetical protein
MADAIEESVRDVKSNVFVSVAMREYLTCKICKDIPSPNAIVIASCCGQMLGCAGCVQQIEEDKCILCNVEGLFSKVINLKGFDPIVNVLTSTNNTSSA